MKTEEYKSLMDILYNQKKKIEKLNIHFDRGNERVDFVFLDKSKLRATEEDVIDYAWHLKRGLDNEGDFVFRYIKDLNRYFEEEMFLAKDHDKKVVDATHKIADGTFKFSYDLDELQTEFLLSKNRSNKKFLPLKTDYFNIAAYRLHENVLLLALHDKYKKNSPDYESYFLETTRIISKAFRGDRNFIKNFAKKNQKTHLDLLNSMNKYLASIENSEALNKLFKPNGINAESGIRLVLQTYSEKAEACVDLLNFVRIAHELNIGIETPVDMKKAQENKAILNSVMADKLKCLDPHIRNSNSHLNTRIDNVGHKLQIRDRGNYFAEYTFKEITEMTNDLANNLLPALIMGIMMEIGLTWIILSCKSVEYATALLGVDNS